MKALVSPNTIQLHAEQAADNCTEGGQRWTEGRVRTADTSDADVLTRGVHTGIGEHFEDDFRALQSFHHPSSVTRIRSYPFPRFDLSEMAHVCTAPSYAHAG